MRTTLLSLLALPVLATAAFAADTPPAGHRGWDPAKFQEMRAKMQARRADDIALLIGLRADQRPALDTFLAAIEPEHGPAHWGGRTGEASRGAPGEEGTLARLDKMSAGVDRRDADAKQKIAATRSFYAGLTPDQQKRFDALERLHHDHDRPGGHGGGMRFHHGPQGGPGDTPPPQN